MAKIIRKRINPSKEKDEEQVYLESMGISASAINTFLKSPKEYHYRKSEESDATILGSAIHCLCGTPDLFDSKFIVVEKRISGLMGNYIQLLAEAICNGIDEKTAKFQAYTLSGFLYTQTRVEKDYEEKKEFRDYYDLLIKSKGKHILSKEEYLNAKQCSTALLSHKTINSLLLEEKGVEIWIEKPIVWTIKVNGEAVICKSKPDIARIDHRNKLIIVPDFKSTSEDYSSFKKIAKSRGYHRQVAFYLNAIADKLRQDGVNIDGYRKEGYLAMVETKSSLHQVRVLRINPEDIDRSFIECEQAVNDIVWHRTNNVWDYPRDYYEGDGSEEFNVYEDVND